MRAALLKQRIRADVPQCTLDGGHFDGVSAGYSEHCI
jgi:hypothetical protein